MLLDIQSHTFRSRRLFLSLASCCLVAVSSLISSVRLHAGSQSLDGVGATDRGQIGESKQDDDSLVQRVDDGVRLLGKANLTQPLVGYPFVASPDGQWLATRKGWDVLLIDRQRREVVQTISFAAGKRRPIAFDLLYSRTSKYLAVLLHVHEADDVEFKMGDFEEREEDSLGVVQGKYVLLLENGRIMGPPVQVDESPEFRSAHASMMFSPDERWMAINYDGATFAVDVRQNQLLAKIPEFPASHFEANQRLVHVDSQRSWSLSSGEFSPWQAPTGLENLKLLAVSPDGSAEAWRAEDGQVVFYYPETQKLQKFAGLKSQPATASLTSLSQRDYQFSSTGKLFAGNGFKKGQSSPLYFVFDIEQQKYLLEPTPMLSGGQLLGDDEQMLGLVNTAWHEIPLGDGSNEALRAALAAYPSSRQLQFANMDRHLVLGPYQRWIDVASGKTMGQSSSGYFDGVSSPRSTSGYEFSPGGASYSVQERDATTGKSKALFSHQSIGHAGALLRNLLGSPPEVSGVIGFKLGIERTGKALYELRHDSGLGFVFRNWDLVQNKVGWEKTFRVRTPIVDIMRTAAISADGTRFAVTTNEHLWVVDAEQGRAIRELDLPVIPQQISLNRDGSLLAVSYRDRDWWSVKKIVLFDVASGRELKSFSGAKFVAPLFHPDTDRLVIVETGRPNRVTIYDTQTWERVFEHETSHAPAVAAAIADNFQSLAFSLADTRIEIWTLEELGFTLEK